MSEPSTFQFLDPAWLLLLPFVWWLIWYYARHSRQHSIWRRVCDARLLEKMTRARRDWNSNRWLAWVLTVAMTTAILAAAGPSWRQESYPLLESTSARVLVLDLSKAMQVKDVKPDRFTQALGAAREIIATEFDGETGLVVFAGRAFVVSPLSRDAKTLLSFLEVLDPSTMPEQGTRIDRAIDTAQGLLEASFSGRGQIMIITAAAGDDRRALQAATNAAARGHRISVLAVGTATGGPLIDEDGRLLRDSSGGYILAKTDFGFLKRVAQNGQGSMVSLNQNRDYGDLLLARLGASELIESQTGDDHSGRAAANDGVWLVWFMLPLTLLLFRKNFFWVILLALMMPDGNESHAAEWDWFWQPAEKRAFESYQRGDYASTQELSSDSFLKGVAYYREGQYQQAQEMFARQDSAQAFYNLGNSLARQQRFDEALVAYQNSVSIDPRFESAGYNKRLIELYLQQQVEPDDDQAGLSGEGGSFDEPGDATEGESRIGVMELQSNPADDPQLGPGLGASMQSGRIDPFERFDAREQAMEQFALRAQGGAPEPDAELIERWIMSLPGTSTDLFRHKFLRDAQRQKLQQR